MRINQALPLAGIHGHDPFMQIKAPRTLRSWTLWIVGGIWSLLAATIGVPFLTALAAERGAFDSPGNRVASAMSSALDLIGQPWFGWVAGGLLFGSAGFALGIWLDVFARRRAGANKTGTELTSYLVETWLDPIEAREQFIENRLRREIEESHAEWRRRKFLAEHARLEWEGNANALADDKFRDHFQNLSTEASLQHNHYEKLVREANAEVMGKLRDGQLIAKGFEVVAGVADKEVMIDLPLWRFLALDFDNSRAGGHHRNYIAVQIGKPIIPAAKH